MNRLLLKRAFKSLFRNKIFIGLMMVLVFLTSLTFTVFQSTSAGFQSSYNQLIGSNELHDVVIKENFQVDENDDLQKQDVKMLDANNQQVDVTQSNIDALYNSQIFVLTLEVTRAYSQYNLTTNDRQISIDISGWNKSQDKVATLEGYYKQATSLFDATLKSKLSISFTSKIADVYKNEMHVNEMNALSVSADVSAFKVVKYNADTQVNIMHTYDGTSSFTSALSDEQMLNELNRQTDAAKAEDQNRVFSAPNVLKGYKITAQDNISQVISVIDVSAYQAIVSPTYANANNKHSISLAEFTTLTQARYDVPNSTSQRNFFDALSEDQSFQDKYVNELIWVDRTPYFIIGVGQTPDFAYPIIDESHPTIDTLNQAVVYVNQRGFERIEDAFRTNPRENYISIKFLKGITSTRQSQIMNELEILSQNGTATINGQVVTAPKNSFGSSVKMVTRFDDPNDQLTLTQERVSFLQSLQSTIQTVSIATTVLLVLFVAAIVAMVFAVLISSTRKSLATLLALGYTKQQIALSTAFVSLLIGAVPALIGYLAGFGAQYALINTFSDFWTIPTYGSAFSWISLITTTVLPTIPLFFLIFLITYGNLNYSIPDMLKNEVRNNSWVVARALSPFKFMGIKLKYSLSLVLRNAGKMLLVTLTSIIAASAIMVGVATVGQGDQAYAATVASSNYEYKVDLYSPTVEGGEYQVVQNDGGVYKNVDGSVVHANKVYDDQAPDQQALADLRSQPHWHIPTPDEQPIALPGSISSTPDENRLEEVVHYLRNKIQTRALLDKNIAGIDPWGTAKQLMPDNQINAANQNYDDFNAIVKANNLNFSSDSDFFDIIKNPLVEPNFKPYLITYNLVLTDPKDESYTYIDSSMQINNQLVNMKVTGVKPDSAMYNLKDWQIRNLTKVSESSSDIPILINKFSEEFYNLHEGSTFTATVNNDVDRNFTSHTAHTVKYRVVGVIDSYNEASFITLQSVANKVVTNGQTGLSEQNFFNGMFSMNSKSTLLNSLELYSPSGIYFATDTLTSTSAFGQWLGYALQDPNVWKYGSQITDNVGDFINKYSQTPLTSVINKVDWREMNGKTFASVSNLSSALINTIEAISILLSVLFTIVVIGLIIRTNTKKIATLWTLGYRKSEVRRIFLGGIMLPVALSLAIASPISLAIIYGLREFIIYFGHILIPFSLAVWIPFVVVAALALIYYLITTIYIWRLSSQTALEAFKED